MRQIAVRYWLGLGVLLTVHDLDRAPLVAALRLRPEQRIILAQAVGYPKE